MNDYEDSRNALYFDPNAYIQRNDKTESSKGIRKVVFQEPYECMPSYRTNNDFKKGNCDCIPKTKPKEKHQCNQMPNFDLKNLLSLLSSLGKGGGIGDMINSLSGNGGLTNILSSVMSNGGGLSNILSSLGGNGNLVSLLNNLGLFKKKNNDKHTIKSTDIPIRDYKRVD